MSLCKNFLIFLDFNNKDNEMSINEDNETHFEVSNLDSYESYSNNSMYSTEFTACASDLSDDLNNSDINCDYPYGDPYETVQLSNSSWTKRFQHDCVYSGGFGQSTCKESNSLIINDDLTNEEMKDFQLKVKAINKKKKHVKTSGAGADNFFKEWLNKLKKSLPKTCLDDYYLESMNFKTNLLKIWHPGDDLKYAEKFLYSQFHTLTNPFAAVLHIIFHVR